MNLPVEYAVFILFEFAIFCMIFQCISHINSFKKKQIVIIIATTLMLSLVGYNLTLTRGAFSVVVNVIFILVITDVAYTKSKNLPLSLLYTITSSLVFLLTGQLQSTILGLIIDPYDWLFPGTRSVSLGSWTLFLLNEPIWAVLAFPSAYYLGNLINQKLLALPDVLVRRFCSYIVIGTAISFTLFITNMFLMQIIDSQALLNMVNTLLLLVYFLYLVFAIYAFANNLHREDEVAHNKEMLKNLEIYTRSIEEAHTEMRRFQHDHRNILMSVNEHLDNDDLDGVRKFFKEYVVPFEESALFMESTLSKLSLIQVPEIKSIVSQKLMHAQHMGISVHIEVSDAIEKLPFDRVSLCRTMGILMDNAIEACVGNEAAVIKFAAFKKDGETSFLFINNCETPPPVVEIFSKGYTTKPGGRGLGLYTLRMILDESDNATLITKVENGDFIQQLIIGA